MVNIIQDIILKGNNRPSYKNSIKFITIHNTGNSGVGANAKANANYMKSSTAINAPVSWHYTVDDKQIYQSLPDNETAWHCGDGNGANSGNMTSIGIEICMNKDGNYEKAELNACELVASLLKKYNLNIDKVVQHNKWSGKNCPQVIRGKVDGWSNFIKNVESFMKDNSKIEVKDVMEISQLNLNKLVELKVITSPEYWKNIKLNYLNSLVEKAIPFLNKNINNGIKEIGLAFKVLIDDNIIASPDYWENKLKEIKYLDQFIINLANKSSTILNRIVCAEARGEDEKGQILVCNVIMNRVKDKGFPNTIYDVVFQKNQFQPTRDGAYEKVIITDLNRSAVNKALSGIDYSQRALYFRTIKGAEGGWHEKSLTKLFDHGCHRFYK